MNYLRVIIPFLFLSFLFSGGMAQPDFTADVTEGCNPFRVKFSIDPATVDMDTISRIDWHFGIRDSVSAIDPDTVIYEVEGLYTIAMVINGHTQSAVVKTDYITVHRTVRSVFQYEEYAPGNNYRFIPIDQITDPAATYYYFWRYYKLTSDDERSHDYTVNINNQEIAIDSVTLDTGNYRVVLRIEDSYGCSSRYEESSIWIYESVQIPNVFLPGYDDYYIIDPKNINIILEFQVFNRYGLPVFSQTSPIINWNGKSNTGTELNTGVYYYILEAVEGDPAQRYSQQGFIHLYH